MKRRAFALILAVFLISGRAAAQVSGVAMDSTKGVLLLGSPAGAANCAAATNGAIRYNSTSVNVEFCNGTSWRTVNGANPGGMTPGCGANGAISSQQLTTLNVAAGCTVQFKVWGAGGGGGSAAGYVGGGGGYATIILGPLVSDTTYYLAVGGGGIANGSGGAGLGGYTGGSPAGGSASGVWTGSYGGTPVVVAGGGGGVGNGGYAYSSFAGGVPSYAGTALQQTGGVTVGADNQYGGGGGGYPNGGVGNGGGFWCGGGGSNYAASGGATAAGSNANPGNPGDADRPANAGQGSAGSWGWGYDGAIYYSTY